MKTNLKYTMLVLLILCACKKELPICSTVSSEEYCPAQYQARSTALPDTMHKTNAYPITPSTYMFEYQTKYVLEYPTPNPNNPFEFAFLRQLSDNIGPFYELCTYNFCTNKLKVVTNVRYSLDWGINNWLIFNGLDGMIWKIKPDGSELTQLTHHMGDHARWSPDGKKFVYFRLGSLYIADEDGESIAQFTLNLSSSHWCFKDDTTILVTRIQGDIRSLDITTGEVVEVYNTNKHGMGPVSVDKNDNIYFNDREGVFLFSSIGQLTQLDTNYFTFQAYRLQPFGDDQLLMLRLFSDTSEYENNIVLESHYFSLLDLNTNEERIINLPE